eukprot:GHUV01038894.1.p2 GENE.GHUV01038894.1~~GHUV01038894.1.p2  ORF type:complete len:125 (-),score=26.73 GHUV01038894.1:448-822(-)
MFQRAWILEQRSHSRSWYGTYRVPCTWPHAAVVPMGLKQNISGPPHSASSQGAAATTTASLYHHRTLHLCRSGSTYCMPAHIGPRSIPYPPATLLHECTPQRVSTNIHSMHIILLSCRMYRSVT